MKEAVASTDYDNILWMNVRGHDNSRFFLIQTSASNKMNSMKPEGETLIISRGSVRALIMQLLSKNREFSYSKKSKKWANENAVVNPTTNEAFLFLSVSSTHGIYYRPELRHA